LAKFRKCWLNQSAGKLQYDFSNNTEDYRARIRHVIAASVLADLSGGEWVVQCVAKMNVLNDAVD